MSMTDPIADLLTRIRNAVNVRHQSVDVPYSKEKAQVLAVLKREGFIADFKDEGEGKARMMRVYLKYSRLGESVIQDVQRESRPGRRVYLGHTKIEPVLRGIGIAVVSTSKGMLSDRECRKQQLGGEVLCKVW
jgi:small subunit ribosomal protein S8